MAVIPLVIGSTVAYTQEAFAAFKGPEGTAILITNCDATQFEGPFVKVSYDLRVGRRFRDHRSSTGREIDDREEILLLPGMAVLITTEEEVHFPRCAFGVIVPKVGLLQVGLSNTTSKIDPGYHGPLVVTAFNLGKRTVRLKHKEPFCCLYVLRVEQGASLYPGPAKGIVDIRSSRFWDLWRNRLESNNGLLAATLLLANLILIVLTVILMLTRGRT